MLLLTMNTSENPIERKIPSFAKATDGHEIPLRLGDILICSPYWTACPPLAGCLNRFVLRKRSIYSNKPQNQR